MNVRKEVNVQRKNPEETKELHAQVKAFLEDVFRGGRQNEYIVLNGKSTGAVLEKAGLCPDELPPEDAYWCAGGGGGRSIDLAVSKKNPKKKATPDIADIVINLRGRCGALYANLTSHYFDRYQKGYGIANAERLFAVMVDVDGFPLAGYPDAASKRQAVLDNYPILRTLSPNYITDTGKKGFQVFWCFKQDILDCKCALPTYLEAVLATLLKADPACVRLTGQFRMPGCTRADGNDCTIILQNRNLRDYREFAPAVQKLAEEYYVTYDGLVIKDVEGVWTDDLIGTLGEYAVERYSLPDYVAEAAKKPAVAKELHKTHKDCAKKAKETRSERKNYKKPGHAYNRYLDLKDRLCWTNGFMTGCRNNYLYDFGAAVYFTVCGSGKNENAEEVLGYMVRSANKQFTEPLPAREVDGIIKSLLKGPKFRSDARLDALYNLGSMKKHRNLYTQQEKHAHKLAKRREAYAAEKRAAAARRMQRVRAFLKAAAKETCVSRLARMLGWSRTTVYKYLGLYAGEVSMRREKFQKALGAKKAQLKPAASCKAKPVKEVKSVPAEPRALKAPPLPVTS